MNRVVLAGVVTSGVGLAGYVAGVGNPYSGRAFSVTVFMIGLTLLAVGQSLGQGELQP